jgi:hypothetical protein
MPSGEDKLVTSHRFCALSLLAAVSLLVGCATPPVDKSRLASVHTIFFEGIVEPPDRPFWEKAGGPPRSLVGRAHVAEDARNAIGATLIREGYRFVPDAKSADAVLSVNIEGTDYGPNQPFHRDCMPTMLVAVSLKDAIGNIIVKREYFYADISSAPDVSGWLLLRADPKYTSPDCSGYSQELVMAAFHDVVPLLANAVGAELSWP